LILTAIRVQKVENYIYTFLRARGMKANHKEDTENPTEFKIVVDCEYGTLEYTATREYTTSKQDIYTKLNAHG
jgi:hypothetical protein